MSESGTQIGAQAAIQSWRRPTFSALLREARPKQWSKNVLVFSVPAAADALGRSGVLVSTLLAFVAFCLAASGTYYLNDVLDLAADRLHPVKRLRPIAAGEIPPRLGLAIGLAALALGCAIAVATSLSLGGVVFGYVVLTTSYSRLLKHFPVFDICAVAAGFFLRAVAGGVAKHLYVSHWFLIVAGAGSLFLVVGKRYAELAAGREQVERQRRALSGYSLEYLRAMLSTTAGVAVLSYCLWAFEGSVGHRPTDWTELSAVPFVMAIMRYGLLLEQGHGEEPEEVLAHDPVLLGIGAVWLTLLVVGFVVT